MTNRFNVCNQTLKLPFISKCSKSKHRRENRFLKGTSKQLISKDSDSEINKRCLSDCSSKNFKPKVIRHQYNLQLSEKFLNMLKKKTCKKNKKRKVFSEEREPQNQTQKDIERISHLSNGEYEQLIHKIGQKVNHAKNLKMYGLQSNFKLLHKITQGGFIRFTSNDSDAAVEKVFSSRFISPTKHECKDNSLKENLYSDEPEDGISNELSKFSRKRKCFSPEGRRPLNTIQNFL